MDSVARSVKRAVDLHRHQLQGLRDIIRLSETPVVISPGCDVKVHDIVATGGAPESPNAEPWFRLIVYFSGVAGSYQVVTKDGSTFNLVPTYDKPWWIPVLREAYPFSPEDRSRVQQAIKRYVTEVMTS